MPPERPFARVALVEAFAAFYAKDEVTWMELRRELCRQAIEAGGDAIIELRAGTRPYSRLLELAFVEVSTGGQTRKLTGVAIRYEQPPSGPEDRHEDEGPVDPG